MKAYLGNNKTKEITPKEWPALTGKFSKTHLDLGTGDGRFVYENASKSPHELFLGLEPAFKQIDTYAKKINRKKLKNALFGIGSIELYPEELKNSFDKITINLPWGTLLKFCISPDKNKLDNIVELGKDLFTLEMFFGYTQQAEPAETQRLHLPNLDFTYIIQNTISKFRGFGFKLVEFSIFNKDRVPDIPSSWAKKLAFGQERSFYFLKFKYSK